MDGNQPATHSRRKRSTVKAVVLILALLLVTGLSLPVGVLAEGPPDLPLTEEPSDVTPTPTPEPDVLPTPTPVDPALPEPTPDTTTLAMCMATGLEAVATDRSDYAPEETVSVTGAGFAAGCDVLVRVTRPDGSVVVGDGTFAPGSDTVTTATDGTFAYSYLLDGIEGEYLVDVLGDGDIVLASGLFTDSVPGGAGALFADAAGTIPKQAFEVGDTVYARFAPVTSPDNTARYKFVFLKPDGTEYAASTTACLTPDASGVVTGAQVVTQTAFWGPTTPVNQRWKERLLVYPTAGCLGVPSVRDGQTFHVFQSFAYDSQATRDACLSDATCAATTPAFAPGDDVYLRIAVSQANRGPSGIAVRKPDNSVACTIGFIGSDATGAMSFNYPTGSAACPTIGSAASDIGLWTMDVSAVMSGTAQAPGFLTQFTTNITAFIVKAPLTVTTAVHDAAHADVTNTALGLGATVHDTATIGGTVTGLTPAPVTFTVYPNSTCNGTGTSVATNGADGLAVASVDVGPLPAGDYSFMASVAENDSYFGDDSDCEPFSVNMATPSVATVMHKADHTVIPSPSAVPFGTIIHDLAIVTGVTGIAPTGTVTYQLFQGSVNCSGPLLSTETVPVGTESSATSALPFGRYTYLATYSGDANYYGPVSAGCEIVETNKGAPSITTEVHAGSNHATDIQDTAVPLGTVAHDKATVTGIAGIAVTGMVKYELFGNEACEAGVSQPITTETLSVGTESSATAALGAGKYSYLATYLGDGNYTSVTADCESFTVDKATPTIRTEVHDATHVVLAPPTSAIALGSIIHDSAILGGQVDGIVIGGTVTYTVYRTAFGEPAQNCAGPIFKAAETVAVGTEMTATGALATGRYTIKAVYSGDANYLPVTAACEIFEVTQGTPTVTTEIHAGTDHVTDVQGTGIALGSSVHDKAIVTGVTGIAPTGTVTYTFYEGQVSCTGEPLSSETVAVGTESAPTGPLAHGRYTYLATYSGDVNYVGAPAACELVEVAKATPTIVTQVHRAVTGNAHLVVPSPSEIPLGSIVHDSATLGGQVDGFVIDGNVTYTVYRTAFGDPAQNCAGPVFKDAEIVAVGSETTATGALATGRYTIKAVYGGNDNYKEATAACEIFEVAKATPTIRTEVHTATHEVVSPPTSAVDLGSIVHDKAFLGGQVDGFVIDGNVTYTLYRTAFGDPAQNCAGPIFKAAEIVAVGGETTPVGPLGSGRYTYLAVYGGNSNYTEATAACEIFEVKKGETSVTTELHEGLAANAADHIVIPISGYTFAPTVHDLATVSGEVAGVPMIETSKVRYNFYANNTCSGTAVQTALANLGAESFDRTGLVPGQYAFRAEYVGDANYKASVSDCEPFTVVPNNAVTSSSLCTFDFDSERDGSQFRLIYTPDLANPVYKLNASNPGQFYYNVFYTGVGGEDVTITIPAPFVTQGANPVHVYTGVTPVTTDGVTCYTPGTELTGATIEGAPITGTIGGKITVTLPPLLNQFAYIAVHLDYGWKKALTGCENMSGTAECTVPAVTINNNQGYTFGFTDGSSGSTIVYSINEFKKNPGVGGSLLKANSEEPIADTSVEVWIGTKKMATVKTDIDGWFMWSYKYTGKPVTFTAKVPAYGLVQSATLKSNGFVALSFLAP